MQNLLDELTDLLARDERLIADGKVLKNKVVELALAMDKDLLGLLLSSSAMKKHFFASAGATQVFDKDAFHRFVRNKTFLPDSYTSYKNKIGLYSSNEYLSESKEIVLAWPYKDCVLEGGQDKDDAKRDEVFWNETLASDQIDRLLSPKALVNFKLRGKKAKATKKTPIRLSANDNLVVKGNNLLTLHSLLPVHEGKVKLIYIDPPYNTDNDSFKYNDSFTHSTWLTFMRSRLEVAKRMMSSTGVIAISIDQNEAFYLKVLCDEIFGRQNFIAAVTVQNNPKGRVLDKHFSTSHEYLLFYSKSKLPVEMSLKKSDTDIKKDYKEEDKDGHFRALELRNTHREFGRHNRANMYFPLYVDPTDGSVMLEKTEFHTKAVLPNWDDGYEGCWTWGRTKAELQSALLVGRQVKGKWKIYRKSYSTSDDGEVVSKKLKTIWFSKDFRTEAGQKALDAIVGAGKFRSPKSVQLIKTIVDLVTESREQDVVLDFFGGSGTTAQAVIELNREDGGDRSFILCEQMDYLETVALKRIDSVIEDEQYVYCELARANEIYAERIVQAKSSRDLAAIWDDMKGRAFLSYRVDQDSMNPRKSDFKALTLKEQKRILTSVLDKNMLYVPLSELADKAYRISGADQALNRQLFGLGK